MSAAGLINSTDTVQLGTDASYVVATSGPIQDRSSYVRILNDFNPFRWPELQTDDSPRWYRFGTVPGVDYPSVRPLEFTLDVKRSSAAAFRSLMNSLSTICKPIETVGLEQELAFQFAGVKMVLFGRYRGLDVVDVNRIGNYEATIRIRFLATDPVIYQAAEVFQSINVYTTLVTDLHTNFTARIQQPFTAGPANYTTLTGGGQVPINRWRLTIKGPALNPAFVTTVPNEGFWVAGTANSRPALGQVINVRADLHTVYNNSGTEMRNDHTYPSGWNSIAATGANASVMVNNRVAASETISAGTTPTADLYYRIGYWTLPT